MRRAIFILAAHADEGAPGCGDPIRQLAYAEAGDAVPALFFLA